MEDKCQRCGDVGSDRRTLWMACMYEMRELGLPFEMKQLNKDGAFFYTLLVCKDCRADWLKSIKYWFNSKPQVVTYQDRLPWSPAIPEDV